MERVYVANLPPDIRIKDIDDFFRPFGKLVFIDVNHRANPVCAYVQFENSRNAFNAVKARHGYDYEGYTLKLRLVENEVRKRRDPTPPPPPPPILDNFDRRMNNNHGGGNYMGSSYNSQWSNNNRSDMQQFPTNRSSMSQTNANFSANRSNIQQSSMMPYSSGGRSNMEQQFSNLNRSNMQQQFSNASHSNMQQQYSNSYRSNMPQQNNFDNYPNMEQRNVMPYSSGRSNMQQQNSNAIRPNIPQLQNMNIQYPDNNSWNNGNFGNNDFGNSYNNMGPNENFNQNNYPQTNEDLEAKYTSGLSGAGRRWYNRFVRQGFSPSEARAKALERRTLPYLRDDPKNKPMPDVQIQNDSTNVALEAIGNSIISLLSTNPGDNMGMPGPSSSMAQAPRNAVSKRQYLKSLGILKTIRQKPVRSDKDRLSLKYHTQIVKDYEMFNKVGSRNDGASKAADKPIISKRSEEQIYELMRKQKAKLLKNARDLGSETKRKRFGGAYKKRSKILMDHGFLDMEAKALAWNPLDKLEELLALKKEYDLIAKKTVFIPASKASLASAPKIVVYRNDLQYLEEYAKHRIKGLSKKILRGLRDCLQRIHEYEKKEKLPLTENKFTKLLLKVTSSEHFTKGLPMPPRNPNAVKKTKKNVKGEDSKNNNKADDKMSEKKEDAKENVNNKNDEITNKANEGSDGTEENQGGEEQINEENDNQDVEIQDNEENEQVEGNEEDYDDAENIGENDETANVEEQNAEK